MMRTMRVALLAFFLVIFVLLPGAGLKAAAWEVPAEYVNTVTMARETIWKAITSGVGSGATIAIMDQGQIVYSEGIGVANRSTNRPVNANTRFNIGSTSKMFVAVAILLLVDEGKVALDQSVTTYIPEFSMQDARYRDITVRMLFNHSSGLPGSSFYTGYEPDANMHSILLETLRVSRLKHAPGAMSIYCNDGFTLAEMIVERVSGVFFLDFLTQRILTPLGMVNTGVSVGESGGADVAEYYETTTGVRYPRQVVPVYAAGGLSSTAEDLCRFGDSLSPYGTNRLLSDISLEELLTTQPTLLSDKLRGRQMISEFGWDYSDLHGYMERGIQVLGKSGGTYFYSTNLQIVPHERIVIAFSISGSASGELLTRPILNALMKDKGLMDTPAQTPKRPVPPEPIPSNLLSYEGYYVNESGLVKAYVDRNNQVLRIIPQPSGATFPEPAASAITFTYNGSSFFNHESNLEIYFTTIADTDYIATSVYDFHWLWYQKLKPAELPQQLQIDPHEKIWLIRNAPSYIQEGGQLAVQSLIHDELPGYVDFDGVKRIDGEYSARIAATAFRDQSDIALAHHDGTMWLRHANFFFSVADDFGIVRKNHSTLFGETVTTVRIGQAGYNEWLRVEDDLVLRFERPENGRVIVTNTAGTLFDSVVDSGSIFVPAGNFVFFAGAPGDLFQISDVVTEPKYPDEIIAMFYREILSRDAEQSELDYWMGRHAEGRRLSHIAADIFLSEESAARGIDMYATTQGELDVIEMFYKTLLGRPSDAAGKAYWQGLLEQGVTLGEIGVMFFISEEFQVRGIDVQGQGNHGYRGAAR